MKQEPNKSLIGIFLIAGILVFSFIVGRVVWHKYVGVKDNVFVMYFEESLQGLNEGAPIVFQGVEIGKVSSIRIIADEDNLKFRVAVYSHLKPTGVLSNKGGQEAFLNRKNPQKLIRMLIQRGLKARLVTQSYLTGQLMIELVMLPEAEVLINPEETKYPQIPTVLSKEGLIAKGLDQLKIQEMIDRIEKVWSIFEKELPVLLPALTNSAANLNKTLSQTAVKSGETLNNINKTMQDISDAARSMQNLTDYLERHPESLIAGKK